MTTLLLLAACGGAEATARGDQLPTDATLAAGEEAVRPAPGLITAAEVAALAGSGVTVIDVRTPEEYAEGHIAGSTLIDFYGADFAAQIAELDRDGEYLLYCRSGNRSGQTAGLMSELGFDTVYDLDGGVIAYDAAGLPLER